MTRVGSVGLSFGADQGPVQVYGLSAAHHCEVLIDGVVVGQLYGMKNGKFYEYRGKGIGKDGIEYFASE